ncbi:sensor histidine kinase [Aquimarina sp. AU474]|uniref:sensor histidine kinase n=1 Tax=Aquimarina sp. AU474 TaxID=2108529 RepID=UPI000D687A26|nr:sensor histidine kinase [Aquimarina sp. AU474]
MSKLDSWIDNKLIQNISIWIFVLLIFTMVIQAENRLTTSLAIIAFMIPPIYISNLRVLPLFFKNKPTKGIILFCLNAATFTFLGVLLLSNFFKNFKWGMVLNVFGGIILILLFGTALKLARDSFIRRQEEKNAELKLLKAQLNPHFLFNTLNNLYGLSVVKSNKLPDLMLKLSDLLRYSLYETKETFVPLEKEITYLENYISLERIRLEDQTDIQFVKKGNLSSKNIAPMLFIVFVENAFKHLSNSEDKKGRVFVSIQEENEKLIFKCENTIDNINVSEENMEKGKSGIGLKNAKKRLDLMYSAKHSLHIDKSDLLYSVELILDL